jgi:uncharacterized protein Yka (UPF0111/DUF47 family)
VPGDANRQLLSRISRSGRNVARSAVLLREVFENHPDSAAQVGELKECEALGDRITHEIILRLSRRGWRRPFGPLDGHALATELDDIVDYAEQTADLLTLYGIEAPMAQGEALADVLVGAAQEVSECLEDLVHGRYYAERLVAIDGLEKEGDRLYRDALVVLFAEGIDPIMVIRWKDVFASLEQAIDACKTVAHRLEGIALRRR